MNHHHILTSIPLIVSVEPYDMRAHIACGDDVEKKRTLEQTLKTVETYRIRYTVGSLTIVGYVSLPKAGTSLPCIIHLRGGARDFGMLTPQGVYNHLARFATKGYVVIATQYPGVEGGDGSDTFGGEADLASITTLRNILKHIPCADARAIGIKGHSRGGLMTCMLLRNVSWVTAAVIASAPTNSTQMNTSRSEWKKYQETFFKKSKEEYLKRSPIHWVDTFPKNVPILLMHGSADLRVSAEQSIALSGAFFKHHIPHRFILFDGADHNITEYRDEYYAHIHTWFERFLKRKEPIPNLTPHGM